MLLCHLRDKLKPFPNLRGHLQLYSGNEFDLVFLNQSQTCLSSLIAHNYVSALIFELP